MSAFSSRTQCVNSMRPEVILTLGDGMVPKNIDKDSAPNHSLNNINTCNNICTSPCDQQIFSYDGEFLNCGEFI